VTGTAFLGVPVEWHDALPSTNDEAFRRSAEGAPEGLVVATRTQTAGRGRQGRAWRDVPGRSLLFSVLLRPEPPVSTWPLWALAMAASVAEAGRAATGASLRVKWPNDVVWDGRKLCGVLAESRGAGDGRPGPLVIGTGINVAQDVEDFPPELRASATSFRLAAGAAAFGPAGAGPADAGPAGARPVSVPDPDALLGDVLARFGARHALARAHGPAALFEAVAKWLPSVGARVAVRLGDRRLEGTVESVLETGALRLRDAATGVVETVAAGELA
jgi:biotin-(acetyl-CoA carboxylase) ligase